MRIARAALLSLACLTLLGSGPCELPFFRFSAPAPAQLSLPGDVAWVLEVPLAWRALPVEVELDGVSLDPAGWSRGPAAVRGTLPELGEGDYELRATLRLPSWLTGLLAERPALHAVRRFEVAALRDPDVCETLTDEECLLPYPSSRYLEPADTPTGFRVALPADALPEVLQTPLSPAPFLALDGFGPGVHPLMFFRDVDLAASGAPGLDPETRTFDRRSLEPDSPTLLIDAETGERVLHFVELDARVGVSVDPSRQVTFLRPGVTLTPGRRYVVAVRHLVDRSGAPIEAEPGFAVLRDRRPTTIESIETRRAHHEALFRILGDAGVPRHELILAFDFVIQSQERLTSVLLAMRDRTYAWLDEQVAADAPLFEVTEVEESDCSEGGVWRDVQGTFRAPLFLDRNPLTENRELGVLLFDDDGLPTFEQVVDARFTVLVPCSVLDGERVVRPLLHAHAGGGDFREAARYHRNWNGTNPDNPTPGVPDRDTPMVAPHFLVGGTDNHGFGRLEFEGLGQSFLFKLFFEAEGAPALSGRVLQGQVNLTILGRLMKRALFNADPTFQTPDGAGVFPGPAEDLYLWGVSFGGYSSLIHGAVSPDVDRVLPVVAVVNFANQAQRDVVFDGVDFLLPIALGPDSMTHALVIALSHDLWAQVDPVAWQRHLTRDPLPGSRTKPVLLAVGRLDQKSPNWFSDVAARDLGLASLEGSIRAGLVDVPDAAGPLESAYMAYWTALDPDDPAHAPYLPPLANLTAEATVCDPHILTWLTPAFLDQAAAFLRPDGAVRNTCTGPCDGAQAVEREFGNAARCDPTL
ncbi:MAG: hypothetical protein QNK03_06780 [Myxococcota bacterium]|nr:hypothetical protein [Myxococcota bacterium]